MGEAWGRASIGEYRSLDLRAHEILRGVPLHDVWRVELAGGAPGLTLADVRPLLAFERLMTVNPIVRGLFVLRGLLGRLLSRRASPSPSMNPHSFLYRLGTADRERSVVEPGSSDGPFTVLFQHERESASEVINSTVHAFSVLALDTRPHGHRLFWAIYVEPVGWLTPWYMALIDPFRRWLVYPAILRSVHRSWHSARVC